MRHNQNGLMLNHLQDSPVKLISSPELSEAFKRFQILNERFPFIIFFPEISLVIKICLFAIPICSAGILLGCNCSGASANNLVTDKVGVANVLR